MSRTLRPRRLLRVALGAAVLVVAAAAGLAARSHLTIDSATLNFDPNDNDWYVTSEVCNQESGGYSGSLLYELRLLKDGRYWSIGSQKSVKNLNAGACRETDDMAIRVNTNVPRGTYQIQLIVGEYSGNTYVARDSVTFNKTFIRGGGRP